MKKRSVRDYAIYFAPAVVLTLAGFIVAYQFVAPAPPRQITIAAGQPGGAYHRIAQRFREILARDQVDLVVRETSGSVENLRLLTGSDREVDVIFMQGGVGGVSGVEGLVSLGSLYYEPIWVFHRADLTVRRLSDLKGRQVAVGPEGSGTRHLALELLALNGVTPENTRLLGLDGASAVERLKARDIDAAFTVVAFPQEAVAELLSTPEIRLLSFSRGEAYVRRLPFLSGVELPQGVVDFEGDLPEADVRLLAPTAQLVARSGFHPALIDLLLQAAEEVGSPAGLFEKPGEFPAPRFLDFPLSEEAERYYRTGPPFLRRYLPFWVANFLIRMKVMLLPLLALLLPLVKLLPPFYQWRVRRRIFRWYDRLMEIDQDLLHGRACDHREAIMARLDWIEQKLSETSVPLGYSRELYDMRIHIDMLRKKLVASAAACDPAPSAERRAASSG